MAKSATRRRPTTASERATRSPRQPRTKSAAAPLTSIDPVDIERRAYELFAARGFEHGHDLEDWLRAEQELLGRE